MERTLILIKPDAVARRLAGRIMSRLEEKGLLILAVKMFRFTREAAERFYTVHAGKPFYEPLVRFMTSGPSIAIVAAGKEAIAVVRKLAGKTDSAQADPGTIRGDFGISNRFNLIHASDSQASFEKELPVVFAADDIIEREAEEEGGASPALRLWFPEELNK